MSKLKVKYKTKYVKYKYRKINMTKINKAQNN